MLFNSIEYALLLMTAFVGYWTLAGNQRFKNGFLLAVSYFFYASWNIKYLSLIFFSSAHDFAIGILMEKARSNAQRRALLAASVIVNLGILSIFKYFNFFASSFSQLFLLFGLKTDPVVLHLLLPVGISFYTFQTQSYTIDVYRGRLKAQRNFFDYLLFVSFFPQLVAGPIVRASDLLPQLTSPPKLTAKDAGSAVFLIAIGLVKKVAIADFLGAHLVDPVFSNPAMYSSLETLAAVYGYAFQIYADFSAYSDIAIGSAALLGFKIPVNFNAPYTAANLREFWQRWHISLSTWLRDYLYVPLGGSKKGLKRTYINLMLTMLLGGLWHGAALTFVFWGGIHGLALVVTRIYQRFGFKQKLPRALGVVLTFHVVCAAWVFFRSPDFAGAALIFKNLIAWDLGYANLHLQVIIALSMAFATHWVPVFAMESIKNRFLKLPPIAQAASVVAAVTLAEQLAGTDVTPFIYFQF